MDGKIKWLNSARLGSACGRSHSSTWIGDGEIDAMFGSLRGMVLDWVRRPAARVGFVDSTTAACDAALDALGDGREMLLHTSLAHSTIKRSVRAAAGRIGHLGGRTPAVLEIDLSGLPLHSADEVASIIAGRIKAVAGLRPVLLVLEHVTFGDGLLIPIEKIAEIAGRENPNLRIIVDGAQAVGLWRPQAGVFSCYIGCFHKLVGGSPATAFLAIDDDAVHWLPWHIQATCGLIDNDGHDRFPTLDLDKWRQTLPVFQAMAAPTETKRRLSAVAEFNSALDRALSPLAISLGAAHDPRLRSHISTLAFHDSAAAEVVAAALAEQNFVVQRFEECVRITADARATAHWGSQIGGTVRRLHNAGGAMKGLSRL